MELFRKSMIGFAGFVLFISLISFGLGFAFWRVLGQPDPLENAIDQANVYNGIVINFVQTHQDNNTTIGVPLSTPSIQTAVQKAFPKSVVESATNRAISGIYAWIHGKTTIPQFSIDLSGARTNLANYVQQAVTEQASTLPVCSSNQLFTELQRLQHNTLAITCRPSQLSSTTIGDYAKQQVLDSSFLNKPITPDSLGLTSNGQLELPSQQPKSQRIAAPTLYHRLIQDLYASAVLAILCIGIIIWQHRDHLRGLRRVGGILVSAGVVCIIEGLVIGRIPTWLNSSKLSFSGQQIANTLQQSIVKAAGILASDFHRWLLGYGLIIFVIGLGIWICILTLGHKKKGPETPQTTDPKNKLSKPITTV